MNDLFLLSTSTSFLIDDHDVNSLREARAHRKVSLTSNGEIPSKFSSIRRYLRYSSDSENENIDNNLDDLSDDVIVPLPEIKIEKGTHIFR